MQNTSRTDRRNNDFDTLDQPSYDNNDQDDNDMAVHILLCGPEKPSLQRGCFSFRARLSSL